MMRSKELVNDYRFFPEPDLPPLIVDEGWVSEIRNRMPALPKELIARFTSEYLLGAYDAEILTESKDIADYFILICDHSKNYKAVANWVMGPVKSWVNSHASSIEKFPLSPETIARIIEFIDDGVINFSVAEKKLFPALLTNPKQEVSQLIDTLNLRQTGDEDTLHQLIQEVLDENPHKVEEYKAGKTGLIGMFMGQIMKKRGGKADPKKTKSLIVELLDN